MKFVCDGLSLAEAVLKVSKACAVRTTAPIMECILLAAAGEEVALLATDGELSIRKTVKAEVLDEGRACVPGKLFADFIGKLSGEEISISTGERGVEIKYRDAGTVLQSLPAEEFPAVDFQAGEDCFTMKQGDLKKVIAETTFCCAQEEARPVLKGCLMELSEKLEMTALDGYRLGAATADVVTKSGEMSIICPARALGEIAKLLDKENEEITVYAQRGTLLVHTEGTSILTRLYQGDFIKKENVVPKTFTTKVTLSREELAASVERAAILIRGDKNNLVTLTIENGSVQVRSASEIGNVDESIAAEVEGMEMTISMNAKYLLDALRALGEEKVTLSFNGALSPFILQNAEKKESLYLILPVRNAA